MLLLRIITLALVCNVALGVKCHQCIADNNENCFSGECNGPVCMKDITTTFINGKQTNKTNKYCNPTGSLGCNPGKLMANTRSICACNDMDFCNGVDRTGSNQFKIAILTLLTAFIAYWQL